MSDVYRGFEKLVFLFCVFQLVFSSGVFRLVVLTKWCVF